MINIAITVFDGKEVQAVYVREVGSMQIDFKDVSSLESHLIGFFDVDGKTLANDKFSPFGKHAIFTYEDGHVSNEILVTWEIFQ